MAMYRFFESLDKKKNLQFIHFNSISSTNFIRQTTNANEKRVAVC